MKTIIRKTKTKNEVRLVKNAKDKKNKAGFFCWFVLCLFVLSNLQKNKAERDLGFEWKECNDNK